MRYENKDLGVALTVSDDMTLEEELAYYSATDPGAPWLISMWKSAVVVIKDWECELIPDHKALVLKKRHPKAVFNIVTWVGATVAAHVGGLSEPDPKA